MDEQIQMAVTVRFDALVTSFVRVVLAVPADADSEAVAVGCAAAAVAAAPAAVAAAPAAAAVVPAPPVVAAVAVAAASSEVTSETLPWIFRHFLQSTNKKKDGLR